MRYNCNLWICKRKYENKCVSSSEFYVENDNVMADIPEDFICKFSKCLIKCGLESQHLSRLHSHIFPREHLDPIQKSVFAGAVGPNKKSSAYPFLPKTA